MVVSTSPLCKPLQTTLMNNEVQRSISFHTAVVQYHSVVGHSPSLIIYSCYQVNDTVCGRQVNKLKLANALVQPTPSAMALKLMACLFTNGNPSGKSKSKDERRQKTIKNWTQLSYGILKVRKLQFGLGLGL